MKYTIRTIAVLVLAPPITFLGLGRFAPTDAPELWIVAICLLAVAALIALRTSRWALPVQLAVGLLYFLAAVPLLPLLFLFAACAMGDCL